MSDEPKPEKATGGLLTADEIVRQAHGETVETPQDKARQMFRSLYGREPEPGELGVPAIG
jgi:hypothetical protein